MELYEHLAAALRCCAVHSHVSQVLLLSTLVPLVKDKLGDINTSKNYRSVAISSILVKLIDWVIILLEGDSLGLNELQFAYQAGCSTLMCTWAALETIDYFLKNGSEVFSLVLQTCLRHLILPYILSCSPRCLMLGCQPSL